jgi:dihydrolipoamide dehydrogenase
LVVLGGGAIGAEMAQALRRLGSEEVTVVEGSPRLLGREEPFAGTEVRAAFEAEGIRVLTSARMTGVDRPSPAAPLRATLADGTVFEADELLVAAGRRPNTAGLGLEAVGLEPGRAVDVDERLRAVGVPGGWLYAVGDCNGLSLLTHMGKYQGRIAGDVILGKDSVDRASRSVVPRVTFTDPQVCAVGLTLAEAIERGLNVRAVDHPTGSVAGASVAGRGFRGTSRIVVDEDRSVLVGATFVGPGTADLLHSATVAIAGQVTLDRLWHAVPSFPTVSEVWLRLLEAYGL